LQAGKNISGMDYKLIKTEYLDSVSGGDPEIICEIVNLFKEQAVEILGEMRSFYNDGNFRSLGLLAHKAKSSVLILGMDDLATMLKTFELQAREEKEPHMYESYISRFKTETEAAIIELDDLVENCLNKN
jgi:HPt (histidine-containing phosphotransfer) domain-containing protein